MSKMATTTAAKSARAASRLMLNVRGPSYDKRRLLSSVVQSRLLYGARVWAKKGLKTAKNRKEIDRTQRIVAQRTVRAYHTVSDVAALMLARQPPGELLVRDRLMVRTRTQRQDPAQA